MWDLGSTTELSVPTRAPCAAATIGIILVLYPDVLVLYPDVIIKTCDLPCQALLQKTNKNSHLITKSEE